MIKIKNENNDYYILRAVIGNINYKMNKSQGYIAMLTEEEEYRNKGLILYDFIYIYIFIFILIINFN